MEEYFRENPLEPDQIAPDDAPEAAAEEKSGAPQRGDAATAVGVAVVPEEVEPVLGLAPKPKPKPNPYANPYLDAEAEIAEATAAAAAAPTAAAAASKPKPYRGPKFANSAPEPAATAAAVIPAAERPLKAGWVAQKEPASGDEYYWNQATGETS